MNDTVCRHCLKPLEYNPAISVGHYGCNESTPSHSVTYAEPPIRAQNEAQ